MNLSKKRRYNIVVLSLLEGMMEDLKLEVNSRNINKKRDLERQKQLLICIEDVENTLTNLRECYNKDELTKEEYHRITQALTIMDLTLSGAVNKVLLYNMFIDACKIPEAKLLIERNNVLNTFRKEKL